MCGNLRGLELHRDLLGALAGQKTLPGTPRTHWPCNAPAGASNKHRRHTGHPPTGASVVAPALLADQSTQHPQKCQPVGTPWCIGWLCALCVEAAHDPAPPPKKSTREGGGLLLFFCGAPIGSGYRRVFVPCPLGTPCSLQGRLSHGSDFYCRIRVSSSRRVGSIQMWVTVWLWFVGLALFH